MFAFNPFALASFGTAGSNEPNFVTSSMTSEGVGLMNAFANWDHDAITLFEGYGYFEPKFQLLRDSAVLDNGVGNFTISSMAYLNSVLDAKGYGDVAFDFEYFVIATMLAQGVGTANFAPGYKMYSVVNMAGHADFSLKASSTYQTTLVAKGLGTLQAYTAYKHTSAINVRGVGTVNFASNRFISSIFNAGGVGTLKWVGVYPGDGESDFYVKGLSDFFPKGYFTASSMFTSYGDSTCFFVTSSIYQSNGNFEGDSYMASQTAYKFASVMRVFGAATVVINTDFAKTLDSLITAIGKGLFNPRFGFYGNSKIFVSGIASADFPTEFKKVESTSIKALGVATFRPYFRANAITSVSMAGVGLFKINTVKVLNSYSLFKGYGYVDFKPGNPMYSSLPSAEDVFKIPLDKFNKLVWTDAMHVGKVIKQPVERKDYDIDFKDWLFQRDPEDTLNGLDYEVIRVAGCGTDTNPLEVDLVQLTETTAKIWVRGGTHYSTYKIEITVNTVRGRIDQSELLVFMENL